MKLYQKLVESLHSNLGPWGFVLTILIVLAFWGASQLRLDGDLGRLLPDDAPSVQGLRSLEAVYADQIGRLTIVVHPNEGASVEQHVETAAKSLEGLDGIQRVVTQEPASLLSDKRLLYLELEDLKEVEGRLEKRIRWEKQRANPFFVEVKKSSPPSVDMSDISAKYSQSAEKFWVTEAGDILVFVHPDFPAGDLDETRTLVSGVQERLDKSGLKYSLTGRYQKRIDQQDLLTADIAKATPAALVVILLFLAFYFRSWVSTLLVLVPLVVGTAAGMAMAGVIFGSLNILTGFLAAVLMGLGVDYGIHLVSRYLDARRQMGSVEAWLDTFRTSGRASIYSGLTTILALGSLSTSSFRAFYEFGVVASVGIAFIILSYSVLIPFVIFVLKRGEPKAALSTRVGLLVEKAWVRKSPRKSWLRAAQVVYVLGILLLVLGAREVRFDRSFDSLSITDTPSWKLDEVVNKTLGTSQTPAVVPVENAEHRAAVLAEFERRRVGELGYTLGEVLSVENIVPPAQTEKLEILQGLKEKIEDVPERARSEEAVEFLKEISGVLDAGEVSLETLPDALKMPFLRKDNPAAGVVLAMPDVDLNIADASRDFSGVIRGLPGPDGQKIDAISDTLLLTEILEYVERDTEWMVEITLVGLILVALIAFRFTWDTVRVVVFLALALGTGIGLIGLSHLDFNFINVLILPIWLGLGVDATFHLIVHLRDEPENTGLHVGTIVSIAAAFTTSMIGFGAMMMSHHVGLNSLGQVAVMGFLAMLIINVVIGLDLALRERFRHGDKG
ncbi:MMPL family transporter [Microvenator marinus]|uniref:MMPL family transporter n=1 Tax=Microvenator marinus TaxID=2600177 RepID=A0A5B8XWE3_9DELT|nr:MMPL family transporter [Microvenator marinus]QED29258.1 MMPL family transporter [Microvenator marinus]